MERASVHTGNALEQFLQHNRTLIERIQALKMGLTD